MTNLSKKSKSKSSKFSRLIAGMQPPKRGSSLVVETGFPTSLIDLFVKNRDRLRKKKSKKNTQMKISEPVLLSSEPVKCETFRDVEMLKKDYNNVVVVVDDGVDYLKIFFAVVVVVVLVLSTRMFAVGISLSAFLLMFLEFVGRSWLPQAMIFSRKKDGENVFRSNGVGTVPNENELSGVGLTPREEGITSLDAPARKSDCSSGEMIPIREEGIIKELIKEDGAEFCKNKKKAQKFIKKFVKRLKTIKKMKGKKAGDKGRLEFIEEECDKVKEEQDDGGGRFSIGYRELESKIPSSGELCEADAGIPIGEGKVGKRKKKNSGCLLILCLVVLAGLLGGRLMGLGITIAWCIVLKFVCKLRGRVA